MATETPISGLTALGAAPASGDLLVIVDVSDTTQAPSGTSKKATVANMYTSPTFTGTTTLATLVASGDATVTGALNVTGISTIGVLHASGNIIQTANNVFLQGTKTNSTAVLLIGVDASDHVVIDNSGLGATFSGTVTIASTLTVTTGGVHVTAGGVTVTAGGIAVTGNSTITGTLTGLTGVTVTSGTVSVGTSSAANLVVAGGGAAVPTNATVGFLMLSSCAGTPSGTPASIPTGTIPCVVDATNSRLYAYVGGTWKFSALT